MQKKVIIFGGLGFIGSNLATYYSKLGHATSVVDGLLPGTGGNRKNINGAHSIYVIDKSVEAIDNLSKVLNEYDIIIDAMGWTSHRDALQFPMKDIEVNLHSHLYLIMALNDLQNKKVIYLGSRGQYGFISGDVIKENDTMKPADVQGIDKVAAESFFRIYSKIYNFDAISLRLPNCFGRNQKVFGDDTGLIAGFILDSLNGKTIIVYGKERKRSVLYIDDLVRIIYQTSLQEFTGFIPININGVSINILDLAHKIVKLSGKGLVKVKEIPSDIKKIDVGDAPMDERQLQKLIGKIEYSEIDFSLIQTINYIKSAYDMAM